jgi:hypothetical protein
MDAILKAGDWVRKIKLKHPVPQVMSVCELDRMPIDFSAAPIDESKIGIFQFTRMDGEVAVYEYRKP